MTMKDELASVREAMVKLYRKHDECEDCWYSCPKSADGCCNDAQGDECNCGAEKHNAILDAIISSLSKIEEGMGWIPVTFENQPPRNSMVLYWHMPFDHSSPIEFGHPAIADEWRWERHGEVATHYKMITPPDTQQP